ncbi:hypothetical protein ACHAW6_007762 [Cyclotella cf. meneghiniana]
MPDDSDTPPPSTKDDSNDDDADHRDEEAAEILSDLLQNQASLSNAKSLNGTQVGEAQQAALQQLIRQEPSAVLNQQSVRALLDAMGGDSRGDVAAGEGGRKHVFWDTQPMLKSDDAAADKSSKLPNAEPDPNWHKPIIPNKDKSELRAEPYNMPKGFEWIQVDITHPEECSEIYDLLYQNYVEDDGCTFRFVYSREFLKWALTPPGYRKEFHLGVRSTKSRRLMALITAIPARVRVHGVEMEAAEVNFLCVHKKLRSKRLAPVLIKEITRRVNHTGVFQAVYTAGVVLPGHVASCRYYHRTLDVRKLVEIGFTRISERMTMARMQKLYKLPTDTCTPGLRPMTPEDVPAAYRLVSKYLEKFKLAIVFSEEEFAHWLLPRQGVVSSFVVVKEGTSEVTDFCSYYHLHSSVLGNAKHSTLLAGYSFYNVATTVDLNELMRDCLILAKNEGLDVFNALNLMENDRFLHDLKFGMGDGNLQYYIYNWFCPTMDHGDVGIVLL